MVVVGFGAGVVGGPAKGGFFGLLSHSPDPLLLLFFWLGARAPPPARPRQSGGWLVDLGPAVGGGFFFPRARARVGGGWG